EPLRRGLPLVAFGSVCTEPLPTVLRTSAGTPVTELTNDEDAWLGLPELAVSFFVGDASLTATRMAITKTTMPTAEPAAIMRLRRCSARCCRNASSRAACRASRLPLDTCGQPLTYERPVAATRRR